MIPSVPIVKTTHSRHPDRKILIRERALFPIPEFLEPLYLPQGEGGRQIKMNDTLPFQALKKHHDVELTKDDVGGSMIIVEVDPSLLESDDEDTMITADDRSILKRNYDSESVGMLYIFFISNHIFELSLELLSKIPK